MADIFLGPGEGFNFFLNLEKGGFKYKKINDDILKSFPMIENEIDPLELTNTGYTENEKEFNKIYENAFKELEDEIFNGIPAQENNTF